ncbi:hypothetical protein RI367_007188 [Sorochytrium milnesiophthora]
MTDTAGWGALRVLPRELLLLVTALLPLRDVHSLLTVSRPLFPIAARVLWRDCWIQAATEAELQRLRCHSKALCFVDDDDAASMQYTLLVSSLNLLAVDDELHTKVLQRTIYLRRLALDRDSSAFASLCDGTLHFDQLREFVVYAVPKEVAGSAAVVTGAPLLAQNVRTLLGNGAAHFRNLQTLNLDFRAGDGAQQMELSQMLADLADATAKDPGAFQLPSLTDLTLISETIGLLLAAIKLFQHVSPALSSLSLLKQNPQEHPESIYAMMDLLQTLALLKLRMLRLGLFTFTAHHVAAWCSEDPPASSSADEDGDEPAVAEIPPATKSNGDVPFSPSQASTSTTHDTLRQLVLLWPTFPDARSVIAFLSSMPNLTDIRVHGPCCREAPPPPLAAPVQAPQPATAIATEGALAEAPDVAFAGVSNLEPQETPLDEETRLVSMLSMVPSFARGNLRSFDWTVFNLHQLDLLLSNISDVSATHAPTTAALHAGDPSQQLFNSSSISIDETYDFVRLSDDAIAENAATTPPLPLFSSVSDVPAAADDDDDDAHTAQQAAAVLNLQHHAVQAIVRAFPPTLTSLQIKSHKYAGFDWCELSPTRTVRKRYRLARHTLELGHHSLVKIRAGQAKVVLVPSRQEYY